MSVDSTQCRKQIDELMSLPQQMWLLGAGVSKESGMPLMHPLTDRVEAMLEGDEQTDFRSIRAELPKAAHVEHVLSHIGDLIAIASRSEAKKVTIGKVKRELTDLRDLHARIQQHIRDTMRWGYSPANEGKAPKIGSQAKPIVTVDAHCRFVKAVFNVRRAGLEHRPPVAFFTTSYDTLLEDAIALCRVPAADGFVGGAMAFWDPDRREHGFDTPFSLDGGFQARIYKLHGSIDWFVSEEDIVVRRREGAGYPPDEPGRLLMVPQATKYQVTQRDPFARLFAAFRRAISDPNPGLLAICGYIFGDDHVNEEIERPMKYRSSKLTVLAFVRQSDDAGNEHALPAALSRWLQEAPWRERLLVVGSHGVYHGSLENRYPPAANSLHTWWSFEGLTKLLEQGPEAAT